MTLQSLIGQVIIIKDFRGRHLMAAKLKKFSVHYDNRIYWEAECDSLEIHGSRDARGVTPDNFLSE